jgi:hypothetical protein
MVPPSPVNFELLEQIVHLLRIVIDVFESRRDEILSAFELNNLKDRLLSVGSTSALGN